MPQLKIAVQLASLRVPFKQALPLARQMGAAGIEIDARGEIKPQDMSATALRQLKKLLDDYSLRVAGIGFQTRRGYDVQTDLERRIEGTRAAMRGAFALGANIVVNQIGRVPEDAASPAFKTLVEVLTDLGRYGQHVGATLAAETGSESGPQLAQLMGALPPGLMGVCLNPGNLIANGFSVIEAVESLAGHVVYVHAKDGVRDLAKGRGIEVSLGRGAADFPNLIGILEEHHYRGWWTIEREGSENPVHEIGQAVQYLASL